MSTSHEKFDLDVSGYPDLPKLKGVFVTGTDTEVGKTLIAGVIARSLRPVTIPATHTADAPVPHARVAPLPRSQVAILTSSGVSR